MANGDLIRFRQGTRNNVGQTAIEPGQLLFATYGDEVLTASGASTIVQGDIYFDLDNSTRVNIANDVDKARTLFAGTCNSADANGQWNVTLDGIQQLYDGITIVLKINASCATQYTTLNVNNLGPKLVWARRNERLLEGLDSGDEAILVYRTNAGSYTVPQTNYGLLTTGATVRDGWIVASAPAMKTVVPTAYCDTASHIRTKSAICDGFTLLDNSYIHFTNVNNNTYSNASGILISINGTGSHPLYINGIISSNTNNIFPAGTYIMYYDGENYHVRTDGLLPGAGTSGSAAHATTADSLSTTGDILVNLGSESEAIYTSGGDIHPGVEGTLRVLNGGTGLDFLTENATLVGNGLNTIKRIASANGAYYATAANAEPQFGTLPLAQGGTGQTSLANIYKNWKFWSLTGGTAIENGADLNSFKTPGNFYCNANNDSKTILHNPYADTASNSLKAFVLKVIHGTGNSNVYVRQELYEYDKQTRWQRCTSDSGSTWTAWTNMATTAAGGSYAPIYIDTKGVAQEILNVDILHGGTGNNKSILTGNRVIYSKSGSLMDEAASLYTTGANLAVNKTSITSGYTFEVSGKSHFTDDIVGDKNIKGKTFTISSTAQEVHLAFSRSGNYNYITVPANSTTSSSLAIGDAASSAGTWVRFTNTTLQPERTNELTLGSNGSRWKTIYGIAGDFSGNVDIDGNITVQGDIIGYSNLNISGNSTLNGTLLVKKTAQIDDVLTLYKEGETSDNVYARLLFKNKDTTTGYTCSGNISFYNCHANDGNNGAMVINSTGSIFIGGGEGAQHLYNTIKPANNENLYIMTNSTNFIESGEGNSANRAGIAINANALYPVKAETATDNTMTIGTSSCKFSWLYVNNASLTNLRALSNNTFYFTDSNNNQSIEICTTKDGQYIAPTLDDKGSLGASGQRWHSIYVAEFAPDYQVTKSIIVNTSWQDIDIAASQIPTGTNIIQIYDATSGATTLNHYQTYWSGVFSWLSTGTNGNSGTGEYYEIPLHGAGHAINSRAIYLRVYMYPNNVGAKTCKLQIKSNFAATAASSLTIKIKHIM